MKNSELFNQIKELVQQRHLIPPQNPSFAQTYCQQQLTKKKLNPYDPRQKMNHIMKNFQQLQTYVDVEALVKCICSFKKQKQHEVSASTIKDDRKQSNAFERWQKEKNSLKQKIRYRLGEQLQEKYNKENEQLMKFIDFLENSYNDSGKNKNHHRNNIDRFLLRKFDDNSNNKQEWSFDNLRTIRNNTGYKGDRYENVNTKKHNIQERKKHADLIHQVSTYLQIILEMQHRNKWRRVNQISKQMKEKVKDTQAKFIHNQKKHNKSQTVGLFTQRTQLSNVTTNKQNISIPKKHRLVNISQTSLKNQEMQSDRFQKLRVQNQFTFRNRTIKQKIMKKVANFIDLIQDEEKIIKEENKTYLNNIQNLENSIRSQFMKYKEDPIFDEEGVKDVRVRALEYK